MFCQHFWLSASVSWASCFRMVVSCTTTVSSQTSASVMTSTTTPTSLVMLWAARTGETKWMVWRRGTCPHPGSSTLWEPGASPTRQRRWWLVLATCTCRTGHSSCQRTPQWKPVRQSTTGRFPTVQRSLGLIISPRSRRASPWWLMARWQQFWRPPDTQNTSPSLLKQMENWCRLKTQLLIHSLYLSKLMIS